MHTSEPKVGKDKKDRKNKKRKSKKEYQQSELTQFSTRKVIKWKIVNPISLCEQWKIDLAAKIQQEMKKSKQTEKEKIFKREKTEK